MQTSRRLDELSASGSRLFRSRLFPLTVRLRRSCVLLYADLSVFYDRAGRFVRLFMNTLRRWRRFVLDGCSGPRCIFLVQPSPFSSLLFMRRAQYALSFCNKFLGYVLVVFLGAVTRVRTIDRA